jgi:hypothetical protein
VNEEPWDDFTVTTGTSGNTPQIVLLNGDDEPVAFLDYAVALSLAHRIVAATTG